MSDDSRAGQLPEPADLIDPDALVAAYHDERPDPSEEGQRVSFGTSGHRGSATSRTFNEAHVLAISEAVCRHREAEGIDGPLFLGRDTHALSEPAERTIVEVLAAHGVDVVVDADGGATPTPVISHAILAHNRGGGRGTADGIVVTPSHNPPGDGGFKYNPPHGGPADTDVTGAIEQAANELLEAGLDGVRRVRLRAGGGAAARLRRRPTSTTSARSSTSTRSAAPGCGSASTRWAARACATGSGSPSRAASSSRSSTPSSTRRSASCRSTGTARSAWTARRRTRWRACATSPTASTSRSPTTPTPTGTASSRPSAGLLNPNHHLAVCIEYLFGGGRDWGDAGIGKTLVSSGMIDRVAEDLGRRLVEVPVGFKWFVEGLLDGSLGFGGEESAGASFLRRDGSPWSTDKDGLIPCLLAAEMTARDGRDPGERYRALTERFGEAHYKRTDVAADAEEKAILKELSPDQVSSDELAGEPIRDVLTEAPGNGAAIGGLKVTAEGGWFAARPSGTEDVYKVYAESFRGEEHLDRIVEEAQQIVKDALGG